MMGSRIVGFLIAAGGAAVAVYAYHYLKLGRMISPDAGFLPFLLGCSLMVMGAIMAARPSLVEAVATALPDDGFKAEDQEPHPPGANLKMKLFLGVIVLVVYAWSLERAGYFLATVAFMGGWQLAVEKERLFKTALITVLSALIMYGLFRYLLKVHVPAGTWFS